MKKVIRASALYDVLATALFALPWTARPLFDLLGSFGFSGAAPSADSVFTVLFANLMGSIVLVWSVVRLLRPTRLLGLADTVGRVLFSVGMATALSAGASALLVGFLVLEIGWALVQGWVVFRADR